MFFIEDINRGNIEEKYFTPRMNFNEIQRKHEYYIYNRPPLEDPKAEAHALNAENDYIADIHEEVNYTFRYFKKYKKVVYEQVRLEESRLE